jgi:octaprenyl-diphosphate synthase
VIDSSFLNELKSFFDEELGEVNNVIIDSLSSSRENLVENVGSYLMKAGGKRIRPVLVLLSSSISNYGGKDHIYLAAAVELIHAATLLHDDVVDESTTRRNKPTANFKWGNKASILVGDFLFSQAFKLMVKSGSLEALKSLSDASAIIAEGEVMQLARTFENKIPDIKTYEEIAKSKTAALFGASAHVGPIMANQDEGVKNAFREYGIITGLIFQIADDLLDYYADPKNTGKNLGDDLASGNITAPVILVYDRAQESDKKQIEEIFFSSNRAERFDELKSILDNNESVKLVQEYIDSLYKKAVKQLEILPHNEKLSPYLQKILDFAAKRDS